MCVNASAIDVQHTILDVGRDVCAQADAQSSPRRVVHGNGAAVPAPLVPLVDVRLVTEESTATMCRGGGKNPHRE